MKQQNDNIKEEVCMDEPEEFMSEFVGKINFGEANFLAELPHDIMEYWDSEDEEVQRECRNDVITELLESAEENDASYAILLDEKQRILLIARLDLDINDWVTLETDDEYRPKESEIFLT